MRIFAIWNFRSQYQIEAIQLRCFSVRTHRSYLDAVNKLAQYYHRSPDQITGEELQAYFLYLAKDRGLSGASCRLYLNAIRFLYVQVLGRDSFGVNLVVPKKAQRIPELLTRSEVGRILSSCPNFKHRMLLTTCYGCGLRVSEVVALKLRDIDSERHLLRVEQGKGAKDRNVIISPTLLTALRNYRRALRRTRCLFPGREYSIPLGVKSAQRAFTEAKRRAGIGKIGGIHALRLISLKRRINWKPGCRWDQLQRLLGHQNIQSTLRYVYWVPAYRESRNGVDLIGGLPIEELFDA